MPLETVVVTPSSPEPKKVQFDDFELIETLGEEEETLGVRIDEVVRAVSDSVKKSITEDSELIVEITGSVALKARGGVKWLFFDIGADAEKTNSLKVTLKTKIEPSHA